MEEKMKKTLSLLAVILVLVFAVSCGSSKKDNKDDNTDTDTTDTENPDEDNADTSDTEPTGDTEQSDTDTEEPDTSDSVSDDDADTSDTGKPDSDNDDDADSENDDDADSENDDDADTEEEGALEIIGRYMERSGDYEASHIITETEWTSRSSYGTSVYHISQYDNANDFIIAQNDSEKSWNPDKWSRFDYTVKNGELYYCQTAYNAETEEAALATPAADKTDPATKGCGSSPWTKLTKDVVEIIGAYTAYGYKHVISNTVWVQLDPFYGDSIFHITQFDSIDNVIIAQNDETHPWYPNKWSRFDYVINGEDIYYCQIAYEEETEEAALAVTTADREDLTGTGCNGSPWSKLNGIVDEPIDKDADEIVAWATGYEDYTVGEGVAENWQTPEKALGKAVGDSYDVVVLGDGGSIILTFDKPIVDDEGPDFAVFENSFDDRFLELGTVEVSSDGVHYVAFDNFYLGTEKIGSTGGHDASLIWGFAGKFRQGQGTMFDLADLEFKEEVEDDLVDLESITFIKIVDVIGDGSQLDTIGDPIYDPYPTSGSAGFDLDAIAVLNNDEPKNEIFGKYEEDSFGNLTKHFISDKVWTTSSSYGTSISHIKQINATDDYIIAQNDADETYSYYPSLWSRFDYVVAEDGVYFCQIAYNAATKADAIAATEADRDGLTTTGCNGYPWSKMTAK